MKPLNRTIAFLASVAHLLAACSSSTHDQVQSAPTQPAATTTQSPAGNASGTSPKAALDTSNLMTGWPPDTPGLRDVVFNFKVTGNTAGILSDDGSGFLIIQSAQTSELAKLMFINEQSAKYRMPTNKFYILNLGQSLICRNAYFNIEGDYGKEFQVSIAIQAQEGATATPEWAYLQFNEINGPSPSKTGANLAFCRPEAVWTELDTGSKAEGSAKGKLSTGEKVALGIVGAIVLLPVAIIFPPAAGMIVGHR